MMTFLENLKELHRDRHRQQSDHDDRVRKVRSRVSDILSDTFSIVYSTLRGSIDGRNGWSVIFNNPPGVSVRDATVVVRHRERGVRILFHAEVTVSINEAEMPRLVLHWGLVESETITNPGDGQIRDLFTVEFDPKQFRVQFQERFARWFLPFIEATFTAEEIDAL